MNKRRIVPALVLLLALAAIVTAQNQNDERIIVKLRETSYFDGEVTFSTPQGKRMLKVMLKQFQLDGGAKVEVPLPDRGMVMLQHRAGKMMLNTGTTEFEPLEGEWMTIDLPEGVVFITEDDAALVDAIIVSE